MCHQLENTQNWEMGCLLVGQPTGWRDLQLDLLGRPEKQTADYKSSARDSTSCRYRASVRTRREWSPFLDRGGRKSNQHGVRIPTNTFLPGFAPDKLEDRLGKPDPLAPLDTSC